MRITLFGATGGTGQQTIQQACEAGHEVTAVVRDAAQLTQPHPRLTVLQANVMDPTAIGPAIRGSDAVVSALGPRAVRVPTTVRTDAVTSIIQAMHTEGVRRLIVVTAGGITTDGDGPLTRLIIKPVLGNVLKYSFADMRHTEDVIRASRLEWSARFADDALAQYGHHVPRVAAAAPRGGRRTGCVPTPTSFGATPTPMTALASS